MMSLEIECNYQDSIFIGSKYFYICTISPTSIKEQNQEISAIIGQHETGKTDRDVQVIFFSESEVHYMPRGLDKIFPNLKAIVLVNCGLKEITREDIAGFENIEILELRHNELTALPDDLLEGKEKLKSISLSNNKLEFVSSQLLQPVLRNQLNYVGFLHNPTINAAFNASQVNPSGEFVDLPGLMKLIDEKCKKPAKVGNQSEPSTSGEPTLEEFSADFMKGFEDLWTSGFLSDFTIIVDDQKFKVHKSVLAIRSKFFKEMFESEASSISELRNEDFSVETVEGVLRWMYTGKNPDTKNAVEVFLLCTKLKISKLIPVAEDLVLKNLDDKNAMEIFDLGQLHNSDRLKKFAYGKLKENLNEPDLDEELMENVEELKKFVQVKRTCDEMLKKYKKQKKN